MARLLHRHQRRLQWIVSGLCYGVIFLFLFMPHPIVSRIPSLVHRSGAIQERILQGIQRLRLLSWLDKGAPWAMAGIFLSLLYISIYLLSDGSGGSFRDDQTNGSHTGFERTWLLIASLIGYIGGCFLLWFRQQEDLFGFYLLMFLLTGSLVWARYGWKRVWNVTTGKTTFDHSLKQTWLLLPGLLLIFLATPLDSLLHYVDRGAFLPDLWMPVIHAYKLHPVRFIVLITGLVVVLTGIEISRPTGGLLSVLCLAPVYVVLLGPASPAKGLAVAFVMNRFSQAGLHWSMRVGFVVLVQAFVLLAVEVY